MGRYVVFFTGGSDVESLMRRMQQYREEQGATALDQPEVAFANKRWSGRMKVEQVADPAGLPFDVRWERLAD